MITPAEAPRFSAVAFYFGRALRGRLRVPVGLVHTSRGGTPAEARTSRGARASDPALRPILERYAEERRRLPQRRKEYERRLAEWDRQNVRQRDEGNRGEAAGDADPAHAASGWERMSLPQL